MMRDNAPAGLVALTDFDGARGAPSPQDRLRALRRSGEQFREWFLEEPAVHYARSFDLLRIPYPAWYAFSGVYSQQILKPHMVHLLARTVLIQFEDFQGQLRHLLFTPADHETGRDTPYFRRLSEQTPAFLHSTIAPVYSTVLDALASVGVAPERIDYITTTTCTRRTCGAGWARARARAPSAGCCPTRVCWCTGRSWPMCRASCLSRLTGIAPMA